MVVKQKYSIWNTLLIFLYFFDISFSGVPTIISTRKIVFSFFLAEAVYKSITIDSYQLEKLRNLLIGTLMTLCYVVSISLVQGTIGDGNSIISRIIYFIIYTIIGSVLLINRYQSEYIFFENVIGAMWIQSIIVFLEFYSSGFKQFLTNHFNDGGNVTFLRTERATGLGAEAAYLTMLLFLGVFCCNYIMATKKIALKYIFSQLIFIAAMFLTGKTGLLFSLALILFTFCYITVKEKK